MIFVNVKLVSSTVKIKLYVKKNNIIEGNCVGILNKNYLDGEYSSPIFTILIQQRQVSF